MLAAFREPSSASLDATRWSTWRPTVSLIRRLGRPWRKDAMFHMVSSTKPVLGVAAMMVMEEGLISPEDPVEKYIPEFKGIQVAVASGSADKGEGKSKEEWKKQKAFDYQLVDANRPLTIHDLLTHTAGLHTGGTGTLVSKLDRPGATDTLASWIPKVAAGPLDFQPGDALGVQRYGRSRRRGADRRDRLGHAVQ